MPENLEHTIGVRLDAKTFSYITQMATEEGVRASDWVRRLILQDMDFDQRSGTILAETMALRREVRALLAEQMKMPPDVFNQIIEQAEARKYALARAAIERGRRRLKRLPGVASES